MTHYVKVEGYKAFGCHSMEWKRHLDNYADSAKFTVPAVCRMAGAPETYEAPVATGLKFREGAKVELACGYDGNNVTRFKGFIKRINFKVPLEVECEGYSYQLRKKRMPNKNYKQTPLRTILEDIVKGTDIKLSDKIPSVKISVNFIDCNGLECLDWLKDKVLLTAYFNFDELYVGLRYLNRYGKTVKHRLDWNVIKDDELLFETNKEGADVKIHLLVPDRKKGKTGIGNNKYSRTKQLRVNGVEQGDGFLAQLQDDLQKKQNLQGYSGRITAFLEPLAEPNMVSQIIDKKYAERNGKYVIEGVDGSFGRSGGRQKIQIGIGV